MAPSDPDEQCGVLCFRPSLLQRCARVGVFVAFYCPASLCTSAISVYMSSQITTLEKQFGFTSAQSGFLMSCNFFWPPYLWPILPAPSTSRDPCSCPPSVLVCPGFSVPWLTSYRLSLTRTNRFPPICLPKTHFLTRTISCVLLQTNRLKEAVIQTWPRSGLQRSSPPSPL